MHKSGFGVFQIPKEDTVKCVLDAIDVGYRHFDTAQSYFNEAELGEAIKQSGIPREEFFITTKVWIDFYGTEKTERSVARSLKNLRTDYIDLVLLHQPINDYYSAYRVLENLYDSGTLRAIGVSNFEPDRLCDIAAFNRICPQVNQVETNPFCQQIKANQVMREKHIQHCAWAPLGEGNTEIFSNPVLAEIADSHSKSIPQIILRWLTQRDIVVLSKSVRKDRMRENFEIYDFTLTDEEMQKIAALDTGRSVFFDIADPKTVDMFVGLIEKRRNMF